MLRPLVAQNLRLITLPSQWIFLAFAIAGLREVGEPARKARIVDLAPETHRGRVIGLYYLIRGFVTIPAPLIGGLLWQYGVVWPFVLGGIVSSLGFGLYAVKPRLSEQIA